MIDRFAFFMLLAFFGVLTETGHAQVATAPAYLDMRLINPAAATHRRYLGFAVDVGRLKENENVLNLVESSITIDTAIDSLNLNNALRFGPISFELNFSPQNGTKDVNSKQDIGTESGTTTKLSLMPVQAVVAFEMTSSIDAGIKLQYTGFDLDDRTDLKVRTSGVFETIIDAKTFSGSMIVFGPGLTYSWGGLSLGYVAEFLQFENHQIIVGSNTQETIAGNYVTKTDINSKDTILIRKDVVGLGYATDPKASANFRVDLSFERMPPLTKTEGYPSGEMMRAVAEATFSYFRVGVEMTRKNGYYVDPYKLIPYFFKVDHLGTSPIQEVGFFGGLKTSKGHSFGGSISQSTSTVEEQLAVGSSMQNVEKKRFNVGLSYAYVF